MSEGSYVKPQNFQWKVTTKIEASWDVMLFHWASSSLCLKASHCIQLQGEASLRIWRHCDASKHRELSPNNTMSHPRRLDSAATQLQKPQISIHNIVCGTCGTYCLGLPHPTGHEPTRHVHYIVIDKYDNTCYMYGSLPSAHTPTNFV